MSKAYEVYVSADEPWSDGLRRAMNAAVLDYVESNLTVDEFERINEEDADWNGWDGQLTNYDEEYIGYGADGHEDADMFVFSSLASAEKFADTVRSHVRPMASVGIADLSNDNA